MNKMKPFIFGAALIVGGALSSAASAQGAGASVDWKLMPGDGPITLFDAPTNFDKQYRVCFQDVPEEGTIEVVLSDRRVVITHETCIDVMSNQIRLMVTNTTAPQQGIFYLVE